MYGCYNHTILILFIFFLHFRTFYKASATNVALITDMDTREI